MATRKLNKVDTKTKTIVVAPIDKGVLVDNINFSKTSSSNNISCTLLIAKDFIEYPYSVVPLSGATANYSDNFYNGKLYSGIGRDTAVYVKITDVTNNTITSKNGPAGFKATDSYYALNKGKAIAISKTGTVVIWDLETDVLTTATGATVASNTTIEYYRDKTAFKGDKFYFAGNDKTVYVIDMINATITTMLAGVSNYIKLDKDDYQPVIVDAVNKSFFNLDGTLKKTYEGNYNNLLDYGLSCFEKANGDMEYVGAYTKEVDGAVIHYTIGTSTNSMKSIVLSEDRIYVESSVSNTSFVSFKRGYDFISLATLKPTASQGLPIFLDTKFVIPAGYGLYYETINSISQALHPSVPSVLIGD